MQKKSIIIVGAGIAGLQAADILLRGGFNVEIFEASQEVGGRIKDLKGWADFPIDLGAEFVHGEGSLHHQMVKARGGDIKERSEKDMVFFLKNKFINSADITNDEDQEFFTTWAGLVEAIMNQPEGEEDLKDPISIGEYIRSKTNNIEVQKMASFVFESYCGAEINKISLQAFRKSGENSKKEDENLWVLNKSQLDILKETYSDVIKKCIKYNRQVCEIDQTKPQACIKTTDGQIYKADGVICTVPITLIKERAIKFNPPLSNEVEEALDCMVMAPMGKLFLQFSKPFWQEDIFIVMTDGQINNFWVPGNHGRSAKNNVLFSHVVGDIAEKAAKLNEKQVIEMALDELERAYGKNCRKYFVKGLYYDWTKQPFAKGGYSCPNLKEKADTRKCFLKPHCKNLMFAGEAYIQLGYESTVSGAIESGMKAASYFITSSMSPKL